MKDTNSVRATQTLCRWMMPALTAAVLALPVAAEGQVTPPVPGTNRATTGIAPALDEQIVTDSGEVSRIVESVINEFKMLMKDSTIIVVNTDGDERQELAKIESFLASKKGVVDAPKIMESVKKQFRTDKIGFAHPIWLSDESANGNACVLGVRQNALASYTSLISAKIDKPLIKGNAVRPIDGKLIQAGIIAHEMYHCYEYMNGSMMDFWDKAIKMRTAAYAMHRSESVADAYATLYVLKNFDAMTSLRTLVEFRKIGMLNSDVEHNTSLTVERILSSFDREQFAKMSPAELIRMAADIRDDTVMDEKTFVAVKKTAIELTGAYRSLLSEFHGLGLKNGEQQLKIETAMLMDDAPQNIQLTRRVLNEITASLYEIGAGDAVSSRYFQPLLERYISTRTQR